MKIYYSHQIKEYYCIGEIHGEMISGSGKTFIAALSSCLSKWPYPYQPTN